MGNSMKMKTTEPAASPDSSRGRLLPSVLAVAAVGVLAAGAGIWWFLKADAPAEVSLDTAVAVLDEAETGSTETNGADTGSTDTDSAADTGAEATSSGDATSGDVTGTWTVDTDTGEFTYESATGSFVGFRIEEELNGIGSTTAVGRTDAISGDLTIDGTTVTAASFEIDLTTITTETTNRDDNVQDALETGQFPTATFTLAEPIELGEGAVAGDPVATTATGEMLIHGVTQTVVFDLEAQLVDDTIVVVGSTDITFSDYGVEVPTGGPVISVDDFGVLELQLLFTR